MPIPPVEFQRFQAFIKERERIRLAKEQGLPRPWTTDAILDTYSFCNVNREHDRVTIWIDKNIREPFKNEPMLWFNLVIARLFNWPDTLKRIGFVKVFYSHQILSACKAQKAQHGKVFTGAYIVSTNGIAMDKAEYVVRNVLEAPWNMRSERPAPGASCEAWADWLVGFNGLGDFIANQVVTDMKYTPILKKAVDWSRFVMAGPGTIRGLNRLFGYPLDKGMGRNAARLLLQEVRRGLTLPSDIMDHFEDLNNLSNCFCEWDKYERTRLGQGRPRSKYKPRA